MTYPTAAKAAEVTCCKCGAKATGTIDTLRQAEWAWYSNATEKLHWCPKCHIADVQGGIIIQTEEFITRKNEAVKQYREANPPQRSEGRELNPVRPEF